MWNRIFLLAVLSLILYACDLCGEDVKNEELSSDGKYTAVVFERNCGATTGYVTHVNIRLSSDKFHHESSGTIKEGEIFVYDGQANIKIIWNDPSNLSINCADCTDPKRIFKQIESYGNISITYKVDLKK